MRFLHLCCSTQRDNELPDEPDSCQPLPQEGKDRRPRTGTQRARQAKLSIRLNHGRLFLRGVVALGGRATTNGRVYPQGILTRERRRFQQCHVKTGKAFGELLHPSYACETFNQLHLTFVSHQVVALWEVGKQLIGLIEVLDTPAGRMVRDWYLRGGHLGASLRGSCSTEESNGMEIIGADFELCTFDLVILPAFAAMMEPVMEVMAVPETSYTSSLLELVCSSWPGVVPIYPSLNESAMCKAEMTEQQESLLRTWFQTPTLSSQLTSSKPQGSASRRALARVTSQGSAGKNELPDFSHTSLQKVHSKPNYYRCAVDSRVPCRPSKRWKPGPAVSTAADLCTRAQLLKDYVQELQHRPATA